MLVLYVHLHTTALVVLGRLTAERRRSQDGQTSAEYALVLLGAASVAILVALWARKSGRVGELLDAVFDQVIELAG